MSLEAGLLIGLGILTYVFGYLAAKIDDEGYGFLRILFLGMAMYGGMIWFSVAEQLVNNTGTMPAVDGILVTGLRAQGILSFVVVALLLLRLIWVVMAELDVVPKAIQDFRERRNRRF